MEVFLVDIVRGTGSGLFCNDKSGAFIVDAKGY